MLEVITTIELRHGDDLHGITFTSLLVNSRDALEEIDVLIVTSLAAECKDAAINILSNNLFFVNPEFGLLA